MILELHAHTHHSRGTKIYYDGISSPEEMVKGAKAVGAGGIFITDHDKITGAVEAKKYAHKHGMKVFMGEEVTTEMGHLVALGIQERIEPGMTVYETLDEIHSQGGIGIGVHPFDIKRDGIGYEAVKCDAMEVFNAMCLDRHSNNKCRGIAIDNDRPMVAGSDAHWSQMLGNGQIRVKSTDLDGILKEIKRGKAHIHKTEYCSLNVVMNMSLGKLRKSYDQTMKYIDQNYRFPKKQISRGLLSLVNRDGPGLSNFYKFMALIAFGSVIIYGQARRFI